jgi:hypothetical protein
MKNQIDRTHYCAGKKILCMRAVMCNEPCRKDLCGNYHLKWPTPEQYKSEYGEEYPDDGAVYTRDFDTLDWELDYFRRAYDCGGDEIVCACTPWGKPPDDWRPE